MLIAPVMLDMGYYILNLSLWSKILNPVLILGFLMLMIPFQILAQAIRGQHFSIFFMPVLYICFGVMFDTLMFVALYCWIASNVPDNATV